MQLAIFRGRGYNAKRTFIPEVYTRKNDMTISIDELVRQLATLGVVETAHNGSFHDLPGSGGSGNSNVRMLSLTINDAADPAPPGFGSATLTYGFPAPLAEAPFISIQMKALSNDYEYTFNAYPQADGETATVTAVAIGDGDLDLAFPVTVSVRVEQFVLTP